MNNGSNDSSIPVSGSPVLGGLRGQSPHFSNAIMSSYVGNSNNSNNSSSSSTLGVKNQLLASKNITPVWGKQSLSLKVPETGSSSSPSPVTGLSSDRNQPSTSSTPSQTTGYKSNPNSLSPSPPPPPRELTEREKMAAALFTGMQPSPLITTSTTGAALKPSSLVAGNRDIGGSRNLTPVGTVITTTLTPQRNTNTNQTSSSSSSSSSVFELLDQSSTIITSDSLSPTTTSSVPVQVLTPTNLIDILPPGDITDFIGLSSTVDTLTTGTLGHSEVGTVVNGNSSTNSLNRPIEISKRLMTPLNMTTDEFGRKWLQSEKAPSSPGINTEGSVLPISVEVSQSYPTGIKTLEQLGRVMQGGSSMGGMNGGLSAPSSSSMVQSTTDSFSYPPISYALVEAIPSTNEAIFASTLTLPIPPPTLMSLSMRNNSTDNDNNSNNSILLVHMKLNLMNNTCLVTMKAPTREYGLQELECIARSLAVSPR